MTDYSLESDFVKQLDQDILDFVSKGLDNQDEGRFNALALREFELQYQTIKPYREYCKRKGVSPGSVSTWQEIPAVPSLAFKEFALTSFPVERAEHAYFTSGTTDPRRKGRIYRDKGAVDLINAANGLLTKEYVFPGIERIKILLMTPSPRMAPGMGMAIGLERVRTEFGAPESAYLITPFGLNVELLLKSLIEAERSGEPIALIGSSSGFIFFFNACDEEGIRFALPEGSRVCDGGGYMGQFGECSKEEYFALCSRILGVEEHFCINVLGMGEISTNFFDNALKDYLNGKKSERHKVIPPWTKTEVVDISNFQKLSKGETGLLKHYDLINRAMVMAVQTDNLGFETEEGFEIIGRWRKRAGRLDAGEIKNAHGGKVMTQMMAFLLKRNLRKIRDIYRKLSKA
ncbi:MAG: acyl-protein synthetase [Nitrospirae bacterium]|nr:acyl-protein synthetase [Nitrospirota bacterium]MCL5238840.1 acyl-protein synthetase [Nitrospirota bacterium]